MIHVIKHEMDPNSNINYRRKNSSIVRFTGRCDAYKRTLRLLSISRAQ